MKINHSLVILSLVASFANATSFQLEEVLVSTTSLGSKKSIDDVQATVQVFNKELIKKSNARSLPQLLDKAIGLNIKDAGSTSSISLRGFSSGHTLILVNGLRRTGKYGSTDLTSIQLEDIERIEIVRGPMSTLYGADALAGVVNIITKNENLKDYDKVSFLTGISKSGQRKTFITKFSGSKTLSNITHNYALELRKKDSFKEEKSQINTDLKNESRKFINYGNIIKIDDYNILKSSLEYSNQDDDGLRTTGYKSYEKENRYQFSTNYSFINENFIFDSSLGYGISNTDVDRGSGLETTDYKQFEFNNYFRHFTKDNMINIFGFGYKNDDIDVSMYRKSATRDNIFVLFQNEYEITDSITTNLGVRYDNFSDFGDTINPKLSLLYKYNNFQFRSSYGEAFKAPSFTNMYSHFTRSRGPFTYDISGNENLKPEESKTYEFALNYKKENIDFEIVHHRSNLENLISSYRSGSSGRTFYSTYGNIDKAKINGTEISLDYYFNNGFKISPSIEFLDTKDKTTNERLTGSAKKTFKLNFTYEKDKLGVYFDIKRLKDYYGTDSDNSTNVYSSYTIANLKLSYDISKDISCFIGVDNIQNKIMPYNMTSRGTPNDPGERFYYTGISVSF